jgi:uncharacterized protein
LYLTYPSTTDARFEHSLGVLYQTDKLARALHDKYLTMAEVVSLDRIRQLSVAALLHDCSHGPFSHSSEEIYSTFPEMMLGNIVKSSGRWRLRFGRPLGSQDGRKKCDLTSLSV